MLINEQELAYKFCDTHVQEQLDKCKNLKFQSAYGWHDMDCKITDIDLVYKGEIEDPEAPTHKPYEDFSQIDRDAWYHNKESKCVARVSYINKKTQRLALDRFGEMGFEFFFENFEFETGEPCGLPIEPIAKEQE